ncbi:HAD family acid phosphatase [Sporosarcina sp. 6E9]|uniref:5' nucleotidase, NT5C type n=1 Tax=Sporosarcina sp. 6E9 TaxID=2819235 RepID=UPI001B310AE3|nr:HAD family acid phosphatase [Sporosarcina sp. 6E9]
MKFGFDIDDTLINLREHAFQLYNKKLNRDVQVDLFHGLDKVEIHELFGMTAEQGSEMWNSLLEEIYYTACPPYPDAVETLQWLEKEGHEIYYITARPKEHGQRTMEWMIENNFPVQKDRFFYGMNDEDKVHIINDLELDYYFDDKPAVLETLRNRPLKLYAKNQSYNKHLDIPRIENWSELIDILSFTDL